MASDFSTVVRVLSSGEQTTCLRVNSAERTVILHDTSDGGDMMPGSFDGGREYTFDGAFGQQVDQLSFFKQTVKGIVEQMLQGFHGTVFSLGAQNTGRSYTLRGPSFGSGIQLRAGRGAILRSAELVFHCLTRSRSSATQGLVVIVSYLTIRSERIVDLLAKSCASQDVELDEFGELRGLSEHVVSSSEEVEALLKDANKREAELSEDYDGRQAGSGQSIFTITVEHGNLSKSFAPISGVLRLVELSEFTLRADKTSAQFDESALSDSPCDRSLVTLLHIIREVSHLQARQQVGVAKSVDSHGAALGKVRSSEQDSARRLLPFKASLLTRLLGESIGGNSKTLLVCHVSSESVDSQVTRSVLELASTAQTITNYPDKRDLAEQALMSAYLRELRQNYRNLVINRGGDESATAAEKNQNPKSKKKGKTKGGKKKRRMTSPGLLPGDVVWNPETMGNQPVPHRHTADAEETHTPARLKGDWVSLDEEMAVIESSAPEGAGTSAESAAEALAAAAALVDEADLMEFTPVEEEPSGVEEPASSRDAGETDLNNSTLLEGNLANVVNGGQDAASPTDKTEANASLPPGPEKHESEGLAGDAMSATTDHREHAKKQDNCNDGNLDGRHNKDGKQMELGSISGVRQASESSALTPTSNIGEVSLSKFFVFGKC